MDGKAGKAVATAHWPAAAFLLP